jgi:hypothetical protein
VLRADRETLAPVIGEVHMSKAASFSVVFAGVVLLGLPTGVAAQYAGGTTVAGYYLSDGLYVPSHCGRRLPPSAATR